MKPNLIIIGAMKAGTTSLHNYLQSHPEIQMSEPKELNYFSNPKFWNRGLAWYESHFDSPAKVRGETSTSYTIYPRASETPERIHNTVPDVKLIYLIRDPINRFISHYVHYLSEGRERRGLPEVIAAIQQGEPSHYIDQSRYFMQLEQYLRYFHQQQILLITTEDLKNRRADTLRSVAEFLEVTDQFSEFDIAQEHNRGETALLARNWWVDLVYPTWLQTHSEMSWKLKSPFFHLAKLGGRVINKPRLTDEEIATLTQIFRDDVARLQDFTGYQFTGWRDYY